MRIVEIIEAVQAVTGKVVDINSSIIEKTTDQLSLSEANAIIEKTQISFEFLMSENIKTNMDRSVMGYWERKRAKEEIEARRHQIISYIQENYHKDIDNFDFVLDDGTIHGYLLLMKDDYDLYYVVSRMYPLKANSIDFFNSEIRRSGSYCRITSWQNLEIELHRIVGIKLNDYRFAKFCIYNDSVATRTLGRLDKPGFDSRKENLESIILLIENGGVLHPNISVSGDASSTTYPSYFVTAMLKDYCRRKLVEFND